MFRIFLSLLYLWLRAKRVLVGILLTGVTDGGPALDQHWANVLFGIFGAGMTIVTRKMTGQRRRLCVNIETALGESQVFAQSIQQIQ